MRIQFGSGGALQELFITPTPQFTMSLPCNVVKVTVLTGDIHAGRFINAGTYKFIGMLHRGIPNGESEARILTFEDDTFGIVAVGNVAVKIPKYAKRMQVLGDGVAFPYAVGNSTLFEPAGLLFTGPMMAAQFAAATKIDIPAGCGDVRFLGGGGATLPVISWDVEL